MRNVPDPEKLIRNLADPDQQHWFVGFRKAADFFLQVLGLPVTILF